MTAQRTTKQQILDAIVDLHNAEQMVTREALQEVTGLKLTIIDDRVAVLVDEGSVLRKGRGSFRASQHTGTESPEFRQFSGVLGLLFMGYSNGIDA